MTALEADGTRRTAAVVTALAATPGPVGRGRPRSADADAKIAAATMRLLSQDGYAQLTMAGVAQEAGVSTATLYRRYANKLELVIDALERWDHRSVSADTGTVRGDIAAITRAMAEFYVSRNGLIVRSMIGELGHHPELAEAVRTRLTEPRRAQIRDIVRRAVARGEISEPLDIEMFVDLATGAFLTRFLLDIGPINEAYADSVADALVAALSSSSRAGT